LAAPLTWAPIVIGFLMLRLLRAAIVKWPLNCSDALRRRATMTGHALLPALSEFIPGRLLMVY